MTQTISPFRVDVPEDRLQDLLNRVRNTIMPSDIAGAAWEYGPSSAYIARLRERLLNGFDWRKHETRINAYPQFTTEIDGQRLHFIHVKSGAAKSLPLLLIHGWPGSLVEFIDVIDDLTAPGADGVAFDVVIPSLPGFGFSGPTREKGWNNRRIAGALLELMDRLGYARFGLQGGDAGAIIGPEIARLAPERVVGVHLNAATLGFIPLGPIAPEEAASLDEGEKLRLQRLQRFMAEHSAFNVVQSMRPGAIAYALSDSPIGLLAWLSELFTSFGDRPDAVDPDAILVNFLVYWFTGTASSSIRLYYENAHDPEAWAPKANSGVPTAVAVFGYDEVAIRRFGEAANAIVRWTELDRGGHMASLDAPDLWTQDVRAFFATLPG
jgi:pimeloyl-ACP methyl ester carboxylesterase